MPIIYEPSGKALEYSPLAANLYAGCGHRCVYCYAPLALKRTREMFYSAKLRDGMLIQLEKDAKKYAGTKKNCLLCFTCDPYQPIDEKWKLTRQAIRTLNEQNIPVTILTKGGRRAERDFDLLVKNPLNAFAATLTHDRLDISEQWEPGAAPPTERIASLKKAHALGVQTWVSFEPVFDPDAVYRLIDKTWNFVDLYKVGKLNYHPRAKEIDWPEFLNRVVKQLKSRGKKYYIKEDLRKAGECQRSKTAA